MDAATTSGGPIRPRSLKLLKVSASQVEAFRSCQRKWYLSWPCGIKQPETRSMRLGTAFHACIENYLNTGVLAPDPEFPEVIAMAQAAMPYLPAYEPNESKRKYINEMEMRLDTYENGPEWIGYIDCLMEDVGEHEGKSIGKVRDYKSRSDMRYNKTEDELKSDTQLGSYAKFGFKVSDYEYLELEHLNVCTKGASKKCKPISIVVSREWADKIYARDMESVREMEKLQALGLDALQVPATGVAIDECNKYGGCAHKTICGIGGGSRFFSNPQTQQNTGAEIQMGENVLDILKKKAAAAGVPVATTAATPVPATLASTPVTAPIEPAVLAPDAPPRTSTRQEILAANKETDPNAPAATDDDDADLETAEATPQVEALKKRGRKPKAETQAEAPAPVAPAVSAAPAVTVVTDPGPSASPVKFECKLKTLLVNALPEKGVAFGSLGDLIGQIGDYAAAAYNASNPGKEVADWRLIEYKSAGFLSMAVKMNLALFPEVLYVDSTIHGANIVLEDLARIATTVIRGVR